MAIKAEKKNATRSKIIQYLLNHQDTSRAELAKEMVSMNPPVEGRPKVSESIRIIVMRWEW